MKTFVNILNGLGTLPRMIGDNPPLKVEHNPGTQSLIFKLNEVTHVTLYKNSWDGTATIRDCTGGNVQVGKYCLHTTSSGQRWFRQFDGISWAWVTDCGTPTARYLKAFDYMMNTMWPYLA